MSINTTYATGSVTATGVICSLGADDCVLPVGAAIGGTFVATVLCEISYNPEASVPVWIPFGAALTAPGTVKVDIPVKAVRLRCSAFTSGTISGGMGVSLQ